MSQNWNYKVTKRNEKWIFKDKTQDKFQNLLREENVKHWMTSEDGM